jgi:hypothetical protein
MANFKDLPGDTLRQIALDTPLSELGKWCQDRDLFTKICGNETFLISLTQKYLVSDRAKAREFIKNKSFNQIIEEINRAVSPESFFYPYELLYDVEILRRFNENAARTLSAISNLPADTIRKIISLLPPLIKSTGGLTKFALFYIMSGRYQENRYKSKNDKDKYDAVIESLSDDEFVQLFNDYFTTGGNYRAFGQLLRWIPEEEREEYKRAFGDRTWAEL